MLLARCELSVLLYVVLSLCSTLRKTVCWLWMSRHTTQPSWVTGMGWVHLLPIGGQRVLVSVAKVTVKMCCAGCGKITFIKLLGLSMSIMHVAVAIYINKNILQFGRKKEPFLVFSLVVNVYNSTRGATYQKRRFNSHLSSLQSTTNSKANKPLYHYLPHTARITNRKLGSDDTIWHSCE